MKQPALLILLFFSFALSAQDSLHTLKPVEIISPRADKMGTGFKKEKYDSVLLERNSFADLATLLSAQSLVFIKNYGPGTLASTSFRGAGAAHTAVLWNGLNLQSPMNANMDLSLIPVFFFNDIRLEYGATSALWGSGAVGGTILLASPQQFNQGLVAGLSVMAGSYGEREELLQVSGSGKNIVSSLKLFDHHAVNNFSFFNIAKAGQPLDHQRNAELLANGLMQDNDFRINNKNIITTRLWLQESSREIPPSMTEASSESTQRDRSARASVMWQRQGERLALSARGALLHDFLQFDDNLAGIHSTATSDSYITEVEANFSVLKISNVNIGINNTMATAHSADYPSDPLQDHLSFFGSWQLYSMNKVFSSTINLRQEFVNDRAVPFMPSLGAEARFLKYFSLTGNVARHYRLPAFNDLYYLGAGGKGNPDLLPESGWNGEAALHIRIEKQKLKIEGACTGFERSIENWILWQPVSSFTWSPLNVQSVWSRGLEYELGCGAQTGKIMLHLSGRYNFIFSTVEKTADPADVSLHKQLPYVPAQNAQADLSLSWSGFSFSYTETYTGYRYTTSDNVQYLAPYSLSNIDASWAGQLQKIKLRLFFRLNNVFNTKYQVYAYRAMPLQTWQFGISIHFIQPAKKKQNERN